MIELSNGTVLNNPIVLLSTEMFIFVLCEGNFYIVERAQIIKKDVDR